MLSILSFLSAAQTLDTNFGIEGKLELPYSSVIGLHEFENSILINTNSEIHSYSNDGIVNSSFGSNGLVPNPFSETEFLIIKSLVYNEKYTLIGCYENADYLFDLAIVQLNSETGDSHEEFNLSYSENENNDEFFHYNLIADTLRIFGANYNQNVNQTNQNEGKGLFANVDTKGNIVKPKDSFVEFQSNSGLRLIYLYAFELESGKILNIFEGQSPDGFFVNQYISITEKIYEILKPDFEQSLVEVNYFGKGINHVLQLNESNILLISNSGYYNQEFKQGTVINFTTLESTPAFDGVLPSDFQIQDAIVTESNKIILSGTIGKESFNSSGFISILKSDFSIDSNFGSDGIFQFSLDNQAFRIGKTFSHGDNLYLCTKIIDNEAELKDNMIRIKLKSEPPLANDNLIYDELILLPNPTSDLSNIKMNTDKQIEYIELYDFRSIKIGTYTSFNQIENSNLNNRIYIAKIKLVDQKYPQLFKIVKVKSE